MTIPKGNMGYDEYTVPDTVALEPTLICCFRLALTNISPWPLVAFFQISLKNIELKITHNTRLLHALFLTTFLEITI